MEGRRSRWLALAAVCLLAAILGCAGTLSASVVGGSVLTHRRAEAARMEALRARDRAQAQEEAAHGAARAAYDQELHEQELAARKAALDTDP